MGYYRRAQLIYALIVIGLVISICFTSNLANEWYSFITFLDVFILLLSALIINKYFNKKFTFATNQFLNSLDYNNYLNFLNQREKAAYRKIAKNYIKVYKSTPLICANKYNEAEELLLSIELPKYKMRYAVIYLSYYNNLAVININKGDFKQAQNYIDKLNGMINSSTTHPWLIDTVKRYATSKQYQLNLAKNETQGAEEYFSSMIDLSTNLLDEVTNKYFLAKTLVLKDKKSQAIPLLQFVIDKGKNTNVAIMAKELLNSIVFWIPVAIKESYKTVGTPYMVCLQTEYPYKRLDMY